MKRFAAGLLAAAVVGALFVASPLVALPKGTENYNHSAVRDTGENCGPGNAVDLVAPEKVWPPNHKYYDGELHVVATDEQNQMITLATTGTHDQYDGDIEDNGAGHTADDITVIDEDADVTTDPGDAQPAAVEENTGEVQTDWAARAERSGRFKEGRTYTFSGIAEFTDGSCAVTFDFNVPHDMRASER